MAALEFRTKLIDVVTRTPDVRSFRFERPGNADFTAGQYFILTIDVNGQPASKPFSFSNSPTEKDHIEFTKRLTGSDFSNALARLKKGDEVKIKMPFGMFTLDKGGDKIVFLSGGIGITPVRSICKFVTDKQLPVDIVLLYGNDTEQEIVFRDDFDRMQEENERLRVVHTLTCPNARETGWSGCCGFIDKAMIEREVPDFAERTFYVCGPPGMVGCLVSSLKNEMGIPEERIVVEHFMGYKN